MHILSDIRSSLTALALCLLCASCAGLDFGKDGLSYFEPTPYLFVSVNKECTATASTVSLPGTKRSVQFDRGYGSAELSVSLVDGIITAAGQKTDSKVPETITSVAALGTAIAAMSAGDKTQTICVPSAKMYPIKDGTPDLNSPMDFPIDTRIVPGGR